MARRECGRGHQGWASRCFCSEIERPLVRPEPACPARDGNPHGIASSPRPDDAQLLPRCIPGQTMRIAGIILHNRSQLTAAPSVALRFPQPAPSQAPPTFGDAPTGTRPGPPHPEAFHNSPSNASTHAPPPGPLLSRRFPTPRHSPGDARTASQPRGQYPGS